MRNLRYFYENECSRDTSKLVQLKIGLYLRYFLLDLINKKNSELSGVPLDPNITFYQNYIDRELNYYNRQPVDSKDMEDQKGENEPSNLK